MRAILPRRFALAALAVAAAAAGIAATASGESAPATTPRVDGHQLAGPIDHVDPALAARFAVLRSTPEGGSSQLEADLAGLPASLRDGLNLGLAQAVMTPASPVPVWIVPGNGWSCIWIKDPVDGAGVICDPNERILKSGLIVTLVRPGAAKLTVAGILPDDAEAVRLDEAQGTRSAAVASDGSFGAHDQDIASVLFTVDGEASRISLVRPTSNK